jgi:microcystin-dependent protein
MSEAFLGEVRMFGGNFAPKGWALCNGQIISIQQNSALFSLLGTTFGGNGVSTFALPDLRGRLPLHAGQGLGLSAYVIGQNGGSENVTLNSNQMPAHTHTAQATVNASARADASSPSGAVPADTGGTSIYAAAPDGATTMNAGMITTVIGAAGGNQPHPNLQPFLVVNFIIALQGIYPARN